MEGFSPPHGTLMCRLAPPRRLLGDSSLTKSSVNFDLFFKTREPGLGNGPTCIIKTTASAGLKHKMPERQGYLHVRGAGGGACTGPANNGVSQMEAPHETLPLRMAEICGFGNATGEDVFLHMLLVLSANDRWVQTCCHCRFLDQKRIQRN